ncbi:MAG: molybdopterin synthase catalytic subunit MoaE [Pseudomonadota bacterium]
MVRIQTEDFDLGREIARMRAGQPDVGAVAVFLGTVRDINDDKTVSTLELEHYPGMTERALEEIEAKARMRWPLNDALIIHRVGPMRPEDQIVLVAVSSRHRHAAFEACAYIMDYLKTRAPFWKKEDTPEGPRWVDARESDFDAAARWGQD